MHTKVKIAPCLFMHSQHPELAAYEYEWYTVPYALLYSVRYCTSPQQCLFSSNGNACL